MTTETTVLSPKLKEIAERRNFTSFWEAYDYFKLASYSELKSLQIASELFNGDVWKNVINASKCINSDYNQAGYSNYSFVSGATYTSNLTLSGATTFIVTNPDEFQRELADVGRSRNRQLEPDDVIIEVFVMTNNGNPAYMPLYKAYVETRHYKEIPELESQIKIIKTELSTELAITLFNDGYNKF
jgi:hypothetical protein